LAGLLSTERQALEARHAEHEQWADSTRAVRETATRPPPSSTAAAASQRSLKTVTVPGHKNSRPLAASRKPRDRPHPRSRPNLPESPRQPCNGCASSTRTWPPSSALSNVSVRPPSTPASHGRQHASRTPTPAPELNLRPSCQTPGQPGNTPRPRGPLK